MSQNTPEPTSLPDKPAAHFNIETFLNEDGTTGRVIVMDIQTHDELDVLIGSAVAAIMDLISLTHSHAKTTLQDHPRESLSATTRECRRVIEEKIEKISNFYFQQAYSEKETSAPESK